MVSHAFTVTNFSTSNYYYYTDDRGFSRVAFDMNMTVHPYDGEDYPLNLNRCSPSDEIVLGLYAITENDSGVGSGHYVHAWGPVERPDPMAHSVHAAEIAQKIGLPASFTMTIRLPDGVPGTHFRFYAILASASDWARHGGSCSSAVTQLLVDFPEIPEIPPSCSAMAVSHIAHGAVTLPNILDEHRAQGRVSVSCTSPALVTLTTGHTGTRAINSDLATEILIDGVSNSATKTISTSDTFNIISRLHRTDDTGWSGGFNHSVPLTISWP